MSLSPCTGLAVRPIRGAAVLLDFMRRELAVKVDYLASSFQEGLLQRSRQRLQPPWGLDETNKFET